MYLQEWVSVTESVLESPSVLGSVAESVAELVADLGRILPQIRLIFLRSCVAVWL